MYRQVIHFAYLIVVFAAAITLSAQAIPGPWDHPTPPASDPSNPDYFLPHVQIPESCALTGKWMAQGTANGLHLRFASYDEKQGILILNAVDENLKGSQVRAYLDERHVPKRVQIDQLIFTLRTQVTSSITFDGGAKSSGESCTVALAIKYSDGKGHQLTSNGNAERAALANMLDNYKEHGLVY